MKFFSILTVLTMLIASTAFVGTAQASSISSIKKITDIGYGESATFTYTIKNAAGTGLNAVDSFNATYKIHGGVDTTIAMSAPGRFNINLSGAYLQAVWGGVGDTFLAQIVLNNWSHQLIDISGYLAATLASGSLKASLSVGAATPLPPVPLPAALPLFGMGLVALVRGRRKNVASKNAALAA